MNFDKNKAIELAKNVADKFNVDEVNKFIENHKDLDFLDDVKTLFNMAVDSLKGNYNLSQKTFLTIAGALAYVVMPAC